MERKRIGNNVDSKKPGTTWGRRSSIRRGIAAVAMAGALALGIFGATHSSPSHVTQSAGSTWSVRIGGPTSMGSTWS